MKLKVIVADERPDILSLWSDVFENEESFDFRSISLPELMASPDIDAILMTGMLAHERYGGRPIPGVAQVLSTRQAPGMPPWVVTTPPFAAHVERFTNADGKIETRVVQNESLSAEDEMYIVFSKVLESIEAFNQGNNLPHISSLGVDLQLISTPQGDPRSEAEGMRRAYDEHFSS